MKNVFRNALVFACATAASVALGAPARAANTNVVKIVSGDKQMVERAGTRVPGGVADFAPLTVLVTDLAGKPVAGVRVNFVCASPPQMACQLSPAGGQSAFGVSDAQGHVVLNQMLGNSLRTYYAGGTFSVNVSGDAFAAIAFTETALTPTPAPVPVVANPQLTITAGDNQKQPRKGSSVAGGSATFTPLSVTLKDGGGAPAANIPITFTCHAPAQMACQLDPSGASRGTLTVNTNASGVATLNQMGGNALSAYYLDAPFTMTASYGTANVTFHLATDPGSGAAFANLATIVSGDNQSKPRTGTSVPGGTASFDPLTVLVTDLNGKPAAGVRVDWVCAAAAQMACQMSPAGGQSATTTSDGEGHAVLNQMLGGSARTYYATGAMAINVSGPTLKPLAFHLTTIDPPAAVVSFQPGAKLGIMTGNGLSHDRNGSQVTGGIATFGPIAVKLMNILGAPIANAPITFVCNHSAQTSCQFDPSGADRGTYTVNTDANGVATLNRMGGNSMNFYYGSGPFTVTAKYGTVTSIDFTEIVR